MLTKALKEGSVIHGEKYDYRVTKILDVDGQGYTYKTMATDKANPEAEEQPMVVREQMMSRCCDRGEDGMTVVYEEDVAPTVESCLDSFIFACQERQKISKACRSVVDVKETFHANNTYYYAVEFLEGETFGEYVEKMGGRLTFNQAREALLPIFEALRTMHRHQALHTNITPKNVRFRVKGDHHEPVLYNLYSSLHFTDNGMQRWTLPSMNCEPGFAPPEQYREIKHFMPQVDIFSLAALIVYAFSGKRLPESPKLTEKDIRESIPSDIPDHAVLALLNALDPDMSKRTGTVTMFREEMDAFFSVNVGGNITRRNGLPAASTLPRMSFWERILAKLHI